MFIYFNKKKLIGRILGLTTLVAVTAFSINFFTGDTGIVLSNFGKTVRANLNVGNCNNWGLAFPEKGGLPVGNVTEKELEKWNAFYCDEGKKKTIYLTFDAGYENGYTSKILDVLKEEKIPAAFFVVGSYIRENPDLIKRMEKEGHIVGNHTMTHPDMSKISEMASFKDELLGVEKIYKETTGKKMKKFYRPPQGKFSEENLEQAQKLGYTTVFWSLAYVDWYVDKQPTQSEAFEKLNSRMHKGAILLLHSTSKTNAQILKELITNWKEEGYQFMSLKKLGKL